MKAYECHHCDDERPCRLTFEDQWEEAVEHPDCCPFGAHQFVRWDEVEVQEERQSCARGVTEC